ncbi:MAG: 30S ribosomal protein S20 [Planctomycetota bacterium]|nr:30S ribosomal protein S20 [Planctomycetota bacterium]
MPHTSSAKKNLRKSEKRRALNRAALRDITLLVKNVRNATEGSAEELQKQFNLASSKIDKAGAKRTMHANKASRLKSQLSKILNKKAAAK